MTTELVDHVAEPGAAVSGPSIAGKLLMELIGDKDREHFAVLHLNARNRVTAAEIVSVGSLTGSVIHPREVFKGAILGNAAGVICGHNHPSEDLDPSREDREIMDRLVKAGELLGIAVLDFLIVSKYGFRSVLF